MNQQGDMYTEEAQRIAASEDPRAELAGLARFVMADRKRQRRRAFLAAAAAAVVGVPLAAWGLRRGSEETAGAAPVSSASTQEPPVYILGDFEADMAWLAEVRDRPKAEGLTEEETGRVLDAYMSPFPEARRRALRISIDHSLQVPDGHLLWFLSNPDTEDDAVALSLAWHNCARNGAFSHTQLLEPFAQDGEVQCRKFALRALGAVRDYKATPAVIKSLGGAPDDVRRAARKLLKKSDQ